jgi:hypothetical protein
MPRNPATNGGRLKFAQPIRRVKPTGELEIAKFLRFDLVVATVFSCLKKTCVVNIGVARTSRAGGKQQAVLDLTSNGIGGFHSCRL